MDFNEVKLASDNWIQISGTQFLLLSVDETERRLLFHVPDTNVSFYITCPEGKFGIKEMTVWSDSEKVLPHMQSIQEFADKEKLFPDLLKKINVILMPLLKNDEAEEQDESEEEDDYYAGEDVDVDVTEDIGSATNSVDDVMGENFFDPNASTLATKRIFSDLRNLQRGGQQFGIAGTPRGDNLFVWDVQLTEFPDDSQLGKDIKQYATKYNRQPGLQLEMQFPGDYPMSPPFVRLIRPRLAFLSGHVTIGGSICMELLTKSGWRPSNDIESILVQVRAEIMSDPQARLDGNADKAYGEQEARDAFNRMIQRYGWNK